VGVKPPFQLSSANAEIAVGELDAPERPALGPPLVERRSRDPRLRADLGHCRRTPQRTARCRCTARTDRREVIHICDTVRSVQPAERSRRSGAFLCHSSGDKERVRRLYQDLTRDGVKCWFDEDALRPGEDWEYEIRRAMRASRFIIVCLSKGSITKAGYVQKELRMALDLADEQPEGAAFVIPVRLEECDVPDRLLRWQIVDLFGAAGRYSRLVQSLLEGGAIDRNLNSCVVVCWRSDVGIAEKIVAGIADRRPEFNAHIFSHDKLFGKRFRNSLRPHLSNAGVAVLIAWHDVNRSDLDSKLLSRSHTPWAAYGMLTGRRRLLYTCLLGRLSYMDAAPTFERRQIDCKAQIKDPSSDAQINAIAEQIAAHLAEYS
jgi:TIR domain